MVSVIIPSYNRKNLTNQAVSSVLAQTYANLEVVVVDDGSRDEEVFRCDAVEDRRVRLVRHEANKGLPTARNTGVQASRGEIVAFLDSDDYWFPNKLESQMALYEREPDRNNVLIYSSYYCEQNGKWTLAPHDFLREGEALSEYLFLRHGDIHGSNWLGNRALFEKFRSSTELRRHQDWDMLLRMEAGGVRFVHCPTPAGVRAVDLKSDRLSTAPVKEMRNLFLWRNAERMTARSVVLWEALLLSMDRKMPSYIPRRLHFFHRQLHQIGYYLRSPRLTWGERADLVWDYMAARVKVKISNFFGQRPALPPKVRGGGLRDSRISPRSS